MYFFAKQYSMALAVAWALAILFHLPCSQVVAQEESEPPRVKLGSKVGTLIIVPSMNAVGKHLQGTEFVGQNLEGAVFEGCNLKDVLFYQCNLKNASFKGANLTGMTFHECDIEGADFTDATINGIL